MKILLIIACMLFTSGVYAAGCVKNARGQTICADGGNATTTTGRYNANTGRAAISQTNPNGVTHTQTNRGGEAYTKNGKGVVQGPGGKTCVRTARNQGCN